MTTARDLMITAIDESPNGSVGQGELSLALAGAELVDLLAAGTVTLDDDVIVPDPDILTPGGTPPFDEPLLTQAAMALRRHKPYESVEDWLWRRGRDLAAAYAAALAAEDQLTRQHRRRRPARAGKVVVADSADHRSAQDRWTAQEPVLVALATMAGTLDKDRATPVDPAGGPVGTILAAVDDAATELEAVRRRRAIEQAGYDNIWRAP
ncbi:GPP34 family phosphoprotein [Embleya sp. NPDC005575]|uniref:GPP34 family phosphoprotein n=1 Tax=Embleya sp. NPDC005575 TaxID=3156892 RepID=UPI0033B33F6D